MFWFQLVVVVALLAAVGWLAVGGGGHMSEPVPDRPDLALPTDRFIAAQDLDRVRFSVGVRGYRMDEVDDVLDRLAREVEVREQRIAELEGRLPDGASAGAAADGGVAEGDALYGGESADRELAAETAIAAGEGTLAAGDAATEVIEPAEIKPAIQPADEYATAAGPAPADQGAPTERPAENAPDLPPLPED